MIKESNMAESNTWQHPFEKIGRGPYRFVDFWVAPGKGLLVANPDAYNNALRMAPRTVNGTGSCALCGTYIVNHCIVEFGDRSRYAIGSDCIEKIHAEDPALAGEVAKTIKAHQANLRLVRARAKRDLLQAERKKRWAAERHHRKVEQAKVAGAWLADHPAVHDALKGAKKDARRDIARSLVQWGHLTENQIHFVIRVAEAATAVWGAVPEIAGRVEISGRIASLKLKDGLYGSQWKMIVECELPGSGGLVKLYGTCPAILVGKVREGDRVAFTASVERGQRDAEFGFFSRGSKARAL